MKLTDIITLTASLLAGTALGIIWIYIYQKYKGE